MNPFSSGWCDKDVMWVNFHSFVSSVKSAELNWGPTSDTNVSGILSSEKTSFRREITLAALHCPCCILHTIDKLE